MGKIKVEDILKKHCGLKYEELTEQQVKTAIKEIVEAVLDKAAKEATTKPHPINGHLGIAYVQTVDEQSILDIKKEVDYE